MMEKKTFKGHLAAGAAYTIFGLNIVFCKDIANSAVVSPIALFSLRALGATVLFQLISLPGKREKVAPGDLWKILLASMVGLFVPQFTFLKAITMATAIDTSIISTLAPIFTMFIAAIVLKEPLTVKKVSGVAISFTGVLFLIFNSAIRHNGVDRSDPAGIALLLVNALSFAAYLGIFRPLIARYSVTTFMKWMFLFSLLVSLPLSIKDLLSIDYTSIPLNVAGEIGFLIFFATFVAYFLIPVAQKNIRPTLVSMYTYLQPIIAAIIAVSTGMDTINWQKIVATVFVVSGVAIVNRSRAAE